MSARPPLSDDIERLYEEHGRSLMAYACSFVRGPAEGEDIIQQLFTRLLRGDLVIKGPALPYLYRAVRNAAFNSRRSWHRETALETCVGWLEAPPGMEEAALSIERAMGTIPLEQREVVVLHLWGGRTFPEIAEMLEISPNTAASRYRYAVGKLRDILKPLGDTR